MLRPTFYSFETAKRAVTAGQYGLDIVGNNLSNMNTPGYTRQRVDQVSFVVNPRARYQIYGQQLPGQGAIISGISQIRDPSLDVRYRAESANWGEFAVKSTGLGEINKVFDEITSDGLNLQIQKLIDAIAKMEESPTSQDYAMVVRTSAEQITSVMNLYAKDLNRVEEDLVGDLETTIAKDVNLVLQQIAELNKQIEQQHIYGQQPNELLDERNLLIDQISELVDVQVVYSEVKISEDRSIERLSIKIKGTDQLLVKGKDYNQLELSTDISGETKVPIEINIIDNIITPGTPVTSEITDVLIKGGLKGYIDILNGAGNFSVSGDGTNDTRGIPYYRAAFDSMAHKFAEVMNNINAKDPTSGGSKPLFATSDGSAVITAKNIVISDSWRDNPNYLTASAKTDPGSLDNDVILLFHAALGTNKYDFDNGGGNIITGNFQEYFRIFQAEMGLDQSLNNTLLTTSAKVMSNLMDSRDAISGVSMNEEATNMMVYQNYYNAAIRYLTALDEAVNQIINGMGIVGRG